MAGARESGEQGGVAGGGVGTHQPASPTLPTSSTPSPTTVDPVKAFSIEKFMGEDYEHWSFRMRLMYTQYKLLDLVEGKEKMPKAAELKGAWMKRSFDAYMLMVQAVGGRQLDHIKDLLGDPECGPKAWRKLLDVHSPTHAIGIVLLARRLHDIKFVDGEPMQPVLDEMRDIFTKLQGGGVVYPEVVQCLEIVIRLPELWSALAINLNSQQPQWSVDYIRAHILEDLRRRSVERSEEGAGYGVGGGKSGFKKKWKGKNKDYPKEDGGGGQGEEGLEDESARMDSPSQPEPAATAKVTKRSVQRGASPHGQQIATREKRVAAAPSRLKYSRLGGPRQGAMAVQMDEGEDEEMAFCFFTPLPGEPATVEEALSGPQKEEWKAAMDAEFNSLIENETWELVELPEGRRPISSKWVFKVKSGADGALERFKSRLVAKWF
ncbi:unnamed protein product [Closterium sp. NIES-54]